MAGCLCLPSACLYDENYLLCYDRQVINLRKTSWIWCWASCISPLHALRDVSWEAKGTTCAPGYSQKKHFWWSLIQLDRILDGLFLCCYKSLAEGLRFPCGPLIHTVTVLSPAVALLCGTFATRKKVWIYAPCEWCALVPYLLPQCSHAWRPCAILSGSSPEVSPKWVTRMATILWAREQTSLAAWQLKADFQMWLGGPHGQANTVLQAACMQRLQPCSWAPWWEAVGTGD